MSKRNKIAKHTPRTSFLDNMFKGIDFCLDYYFNSKNCTISEKQVVTQNNKSSYLVKYMENGTVVLHTATLSEFEFEENSDNMLDTISSFDWCAFVRGFVTETKRDDYTHLFKVYYTDKYRSEYATSTTKLFDAIKNGHNSDIETYGAKSTKAGQDKANIDDLTANLVVASRSYISQARSIHEQDIKAKEEAKKLLQFESKSFKGR